MADSRHEYNALKKAFEEGAGKKAPDHLWGNILGSLDKDALQKDVLRQKVAESFNRQHKAAPPHVWQGVNRQLNIDSTWNSLRRVLDGYTTRKRYARYAAVLLVLIILSVATAEYYGLFNTGQQTNKEEAIVTGETLQQKEIPATDQTYKSEPSEPPTLTPTQTPAQIAEQNNNTSPGAAQDAIAASAKNTTGSGFPAAGNASEINATEIPAAIALFIPAEGTEITPAIINEIPGVSSAEKEEPKLPTRSRFSAGLIYGLNKTKLQNNETRLSEDAYSLISSSPTLGGSYGFTGRYAITQNGTLHGALYLNDKVRQKYNTYIGGIYTQKEIDLDYKRLTFSYQHNLFHIPATSISTYIRGGVYQAWLTGASHTLNGAEAAATEYIKFDNGFSLQLGQQAGIGRLKIGYGINLEQGRQNIYSGGQNVPANFNVTTTQRIGAFTEVFYNF